MASEMESGTSSASTSPHLARIGMVLEDLQNIVTDTSHKLIGKRTFLTPMVTWVLAALILFSLFVGVIYMASRGCPHPLSEEHQALIAEGTSCLTTPCLETASYMLKSMDPTADPCEDFYQYACGGWVNSTGIPPERESIDVAEKLEHDVESKWRRILESRISRDADDRTAEWKLKTFFKMCLHDYGRQKDGGSKLIEMIKKDLKGAYLLDPDGWSRGWDINNALELVHADLQVRVLFSYGVWPDLRDADRNIITIYPSYLGIGSSYYERPDKENIRTRYKKYIRTIGSLILKDANITIDENVTDARLDQFVSDVFEQEKKLAKLRITGTSWNWWRPTYAKLNELDRNYTQLADFPFVAGDVRGGGGGGGNGTTFTMDELSQNFTQIDWLKIFQKLFPHASITGDTEVEVIKPDYFASVDRILSEESTLKDRMMNNYIVWTMTKRSAYYLDWHYRQAMFSFYEEAYGWSEMPSTWDQCVRIIKWRMPLILAVLFIEEHVNITAAPQIKEMGEVIKKYAKISTQAIDWMQETTKADAIRKVRLSCRTCAEDHQYQKTTGLWGPLMNGGRYRKIEALEIDAGFPPKLLDKREVDLQYIPLKIDKTQTFFENVLNINQYVMYEKSKDLHSRYKDNIWRWAVYWNGFGCHLYYYHFFNMALVPPGAMLQPMYDQGAPASVNYGCLGQYFGRANVQALSRWGRWFINGTVKYWWTRSDSDAYDAKSKCYLNYYQNQTAGPYFVDGEQKTVSMDNMQNLPWYLVARTDGLKTAFSALKEYLQNNSVRLLPGMKMSHEQTFFLAAAQTYCYVEHPRDEYRDASAYGRPPQSMTMNGILAMNPEFAKAYKCPASSKLNTNLKCKIF